MILSEFIRVMDLSWIDILWGLFWFFVTIGGYTSLVIGYTRLAARKAFISNELPKVHDNVIKEEREKNKLLKMEIKILRSEKEKLIISNDKKKARLESIKVNYEQGLKGA